MPQNKEYDTSGLGDWLHGLDWLGLGFIGDAWDDLTGQTEQQKEFEQQEYLIDKQNEYNLPTNQMARLVAAGINPNIAAQAIAGSNQSVVPSAVSNNTAGVANGLSALGGVVGSVAGAQNDIANANRTNTLLPQEQDKFFTESVKNWENAGFSHWSAVSLAKQLPGIITNQYADFWLKLANYDKVCQEYNNLKSMHDNIVAEYDNILATHDLTMSQKDYFDTMQAKISEDARWQKQQNDFFQEHGYYPDSDMGVSFRNATVSGVSADQIGQVVEDYHNKVRQGEVSAEKDLQTHIANLHAQMQKAIDDNRISKENAAKLEQIYYDVCSDLEKQWLGPSSSMYSFAERLVSRIANTLIFNGHSAGLGERPAPPKSN